jgi:quercetin dioxygenase-like cupin family protein
MRVQHYTRTLAEPAEGIPGVSVRWVINKQDGAPNFAMRIFDVQPGAASPYHQHPWEHEVFILEGKGVVKGESTEAPFEAGYVVYVRPDEFHQFVNQGTGVLRFICLIPHPKS